MLVHMSVCNISRADRKYARTLALCLIIIARPQSISCFFDRASLNCFALCVCVFNEEKRKIVLDSEKDSMYTETYMKGHINIT